MIIFIKSKTLSYKKIILALFCSLIGSSVFSQWAATTFEGRPEKQSNIKAYYKLDLSQIRSRLKNVKETGINAKPVVISLLTLDGKIEEFAVYSYPVMVKELADQYQLGSYVGVGINDPLKYVRFSVAPNDFQSMIIKEGTVNLLNLKMQIKRYMEFILIMELIILKLSILLLVQAIWCLLQKHGPEPKVTKA